MILLVHLLMGAAIGHIIKNAPLAIVLAFLSHYFLDLFPHIEYDIENIKKKQWKMALPQFLAVFLDFLIGVLLISIFSGPSTGASTELSRMSSGQAIIYVCAFFSILPDGFSFLELLINPAILEKHSEFHQGKIHFLNNKKISRFWRIASQLSAVIVSVILLKI